MEYKFNGIKSSCITSWCNKHGLPYHFLNWKQAVMSQLMKTLAISKPNSIENSTSTLTLNDETIVEELKKLRNKSVVFSIVAHYLIIELCFNNVNNIMSTDMKEIKPVHVFF